MTRLLFAACNQQEGRQWLLCLWWAFLLSLITSTDSLGTDLMMKGNLQEIAREPLLIRILILGLILLACTIFTKLQEHVRFLLFPKQEQSATEGERSESSTSNGLIVVPATIVAGTEAQTGRISETTSWIENNNDEQETAVGPHSSTRERWQSEGQRDEEQSHNCIPSRSPITPVAVHRSAPVRNHKFRQLEEDGVSDFSCGILSEEERNQLLELLTTVRSLRKLHLDITYWSSEQAQQLSAILAKSELEEVMFFQRIASPFSIAPTNVPSHVLHCLMEGIAGANLKKFIIDSPVVPISFLSQAATNVEVLEIHQIGMTEDNANRFALSLRNNAHLRCLQLMALDGSSLACLLHAMARRLDATDHLQVLHARYVNFYGMQALESFLRCCSLDALILEQVNWTDKNMKPLVEGLLKKDNHVSKLEFRHCGFSPDTYPGLLSLMQDNTSLEEFSIYHLQHSRYNRFNEALGMALSQFQSASLKTLELVHSIPEPLHLHNSLYWETVLPSLIRNNPHLEVLNVKDNYLGMSNQHFIPILNEITDESCLKRLDLSNGGVNHVGVERLVEKIPRKLEYLNLSRNTVGDEGALSLARWLSNPECPITELILDWCKFTPIGMKSILNTLAYNHTLTKVSMMWCDPLGREGWEILARTIPRLSPVLQELSISSLPKLRPRAMGGNNNVSDARFKRLEAIQIAACQKALVRAAQKNTSLTHLQVQLSPGLPRHMSYFGRRNELYQLLRNNENNPQLNLEYLVSCIRDCLHRPQAEPATTTTQLAARASPGRNRRLQPKPLNTMNWDVSLWYDCLTRRPDLVSLLTQ